MAHSFCVGCVIRCICVLTNRDLLAWFSEEEREMCAACHERARVSFPEALASFCLSCGAIWADGVRIDVDGRLPLAGVAERKT